MRVKAATVQILIIGEYLHLTNSLSFRFFILYSGVLKMCCNIVFLYVKFCWLDLLFDLISALVLSKPISSHFPS